jgi:hypothetical protein
MTVACDICGKHWRDEADGVRWLPIDQVWVCEDEADCFERRAPGAAPWIFGTTR